ncbi:MAG: SOS response-associated peptidase family protein [Lachnospiraceae bacterium]|nr:SOS response-associated peptidase family protein [Lachnospiraceae bacterium]MBQ8328206.1 SOS response-associated peptidase family protein [Lachnospiraceae bacterium]
MCGRYFWNDDAEDAFLEDFPDLAGEVMRLRAGDYTPGMSAAAIAAEIGSGVRMEPLLWGFPGFDKGKLLINARSESVKDRPTFADSFAGRRCALPAAGFYEWDKKKEKVIFTLPDRPILYLAGIFRPYGEEKRFVVLTREANASMEPVHDRMPLILTGDEVLPWVSDAAKAGDILTKELPMLKAERPYEQISFDF